MPAKFNALATYNGERGRGVTHSTEWAARMAALQQEFDDWRHEEMTRRIGPEYEPGSGVYVRRKPLRRKRRILMQFLRRMAP
jgi:hypothetical protein